MNLLDLFRRKKYASPYYGGKGALYNASAMPIRQEQEGNELPAKVSAPVRVIAKPTDPDWEARRFELFKMLVGQERRSVVLGKLRANDKQIVAKARKLTDAAIKELQTYPFKSEDDEGGEKTDV